MSIRESAFNSTLREQLTLLGFKFDRIESHATAPGIPDNFWIHYATGITGWLEIKETETIPTKVKYRPKQTLWLEEYDRYGGCCFTAIHIKSLDQVLIIPGKFSFAAERNLKDLLQKTELPSIQLKQKDTWFKIKNVILKGIK